jgi:hypothetical protein
MFELLEKKNNRIIKNEDNYFIYNYFRILLYHFLYIIFEIIFELYLKIICIFFIS